MRQDAAPRLAIDLDALAANFARLRQAAGGAEVAPVVKADAYGVGMAEVAARLVREGARRLFVARAEEGLALRRQLGLGAGVRIHVFDGLVGCTAEEMADNALLPLLNDPGQARAWGDAARRRGERLEAVLQVDTGLNRLGLTVAEARALAEGDAMAGLQVCGVISHLACADTPDHPLNAIQADRFARVAGHFPRAWSSLGATAGLFLAPRFRGDVVRPGIGLYGAGAPDKGLEAVATLDAPILQVRDVAAGETVGYGASFTAKRPMRVGILAIGYADGVLRAQGGAGYGWFAGAARPLLGRISMDLTAVDLTGCDAAPGARVELFGANLSLDDAAAHAGTAPYELLTRIGPRVRRHYVGAAA